MNQWSMQSGNANLLPQLETPTGTPTSTNSITSSMEICKDTQEQQVQHAIRALNGLNARSIRTVLDHLDESVRNRIVKVVEVQRQQAILEKRRANLEVRQREQKQTCQQLRAEEQEKRRRAKEERNRRTSSRRSEVANVLNDWLYVLTNANWWMSSSRFEHNQVARSRIPWRVFAAAFMLDWNEKNQSTPARLFHSLDDGLNALEALRINKLLQVTLVVYDWDLKYVFQCHFDDLYTYAPLEPSQRLYVNATLSIEMWKRINKYFDLEAALALKLR